MHDQIIRKKDFSFLCVCAFLLDGCCRGEGCAVVFLERSWSVVILTLFTTLTIFARSIGGLKRMSGGF